MFGSAIASAKTTDTKVNMMPHAHTKMTLAGLSPEILEYIAKHSNDLSTAGIMNHVLALRYTQATPQVGVVRPFASALSMISRQLLEGNRYQSGIPLANDIRSSDALLFSVLRKAYDTAVPVLKGIIQLFPQVLLLHNDFGNTPLHLALIQNHNWEILELMFPEDWRARHFDLLLRENKNSFTPLHVGIRNLKCSDGDVRERMLSHLVDHYGTVLTVVCKADSFTPLQTLVNVCDISSSTLVTMMLKTVVNGDQHENDSLLLMQDSDGETALHLALNMGVIDEGDLTIAEVVLLLIDSQEKVLLVKSRRDIYKYNHDESSQSFVNDTPLHVALWTNRDESIGDDTILMLIDKQQEVLLLRNSIDNKNRRLYATPLMLAIRYGSSMTVMEALVDTAGLALTIVDYRADTPLHYALRDEIQNHEVIEFLISQIIEKKQQSVFQFMGNYGDTCLHTAVKSNTDPGILKRLIDADASGLSIKNHRQIMQGVSPSGENTPLHLCVLHGGDQEIQTMLLHADRTALWMQNATGSTPLHIALRANFSSLEHIILLTSGPGESVRCGVPNVCGIVDSDGNTPLHVLLLEHRTYDKNAAAFEDFFTVIEMLIRNNRQALHIQNRNLKTPLHLFMQWGPNQNSLRLIQVLTPPDAEEDVRLVVDENGETPLHHALWHGCDANILCSLRDENKKVCMVSNRLGQTPLHIFLMGMMHPTEFSDLSCELLDDECDVLWKEDNAGKLPLHIVLQIGSHFPAHIIERMIPRRREPPALMVRTLVDVDVDVSRATVIAQEKAQANSIAHVRSVVGRENEPLLHVAIQRAHHAPVIDMLCRRFAAPKYNFTTTRNRIGETPLHAGVRQDLSLDAMRAIVGASGEMSLFLRNVSTKGGTSGQLPQNTEMDTPLHSAIRFRRNNDLLQLLTDKNGMILQVKNHNGDTPLHQACIPTVNRQILQTLLNANLRNLQPVQDALRVRNQQGLTPLFFALTLQMATDGNDHDEADKVFDVMKCFMIDMDERVLQEQDHNGETPLHIAVKMLNSYGSMRKMGIAWLIDKQQNVLLLEDNAGLTPLHTALTRTAGSYSDLKDREIKALLDVHQRVLCVKNMNGDTPLQHALRIGATDMQLLEHLVGTSEDVLLTSDAEGYTPLHLALSLGVKNVSLIILLLGSTKQVIHSMENEMGHTPLSTALYCSAHLDVIRIIFLSIPSNLLKQHALIHTDYKNRTPLHIALHKRAEPRIVYLLMQLENPFVNILLLTDHHGNTPLHIAVRENCLVSDKSVFVDIGRHALTITNIDGNTPLHLAVTHIPPGAGMQYLDQIRLLIDPDRQILRFRNKKGWLPSLALLNNISPPRPLSNLEKAILQMLH